MAAADFGVNYMRWGAALARPWGTRALVCACESRMARESTDTTTIYERAERLAELLQLSHEAMFVWRLDGPVEFWNAGAEQLYGLTLHEVIGRSSHDLLQTKFPIEFTELCSQLRNDGYWSGELRHIRKDGRQVIVDSRMQLLANDTVLEVNRDATGRK